MQGLHLSQQAPTVDSVKGGWQQDAVVAIGTVGDPADGHAVGVGGDGPLPTGLAPIGRVRSRSFATAWRLVLRSVDRHLGQIESDHLVESGDGFFDQVLECPRCNLLVAPAPQRRLAPFAEPPRHVPRTAGDQPEEYGLEAVTIRDPGAMAAQWVRGFLLFGQLGGKGVPDGLDDAGLECEHGTSTGWLGW